jgi:hypothetical protein
VTNYIILSRTPDGTWKKHGDPVPASSPKRALRLAEVEEGTWVAVPARSWQPLVVKVERTTKLTIV